MPLRLARQTTRPDLDHPTATARRAVGDHDTGPVQITDVAESGGFGGWRRRRHGARVPFDRDELERSGWRTTLEYRENHVRRRDGRLDQLEELWRAEAERTAPDGSVVVVTATAHSAPKAWARLRREADLAWCAPRAGERPVPAELRPDRPPREGFRSAPVVARRRHLIAGASP